MLGKHTKTVARDGSMQVIFGDLAYMYGVPRKVDECGKKSAMSPMHVRTPDYMRWHRWGAEWVALQSRLIKKFSTRHG